MSSIGKEDLISMVAGRSGIGKTETRRVLEAAFEVIPDVVTGGKQIQLRGFGTFKLVHRKARLGRNIKTGATVQVPAKDVIVFKPSKK